MGFSFHFSSLYANPYNEFYVCDVLACLNSIFEF